MAIAEKTPPETKLLPVQQGVIADRWMDTADVTNRKRLLDSVSETASSTRNTKDGILIRTLTIIDIKDGKKTTFVMMSERKGSDIVGGSLDYMEEDETTGDLLSSPEHTEETVELGKEFLSPILQTKL